MVEYFYNASKVFVLLSLWFFYIFEIILSPLKMYFCSLSFTFYFPSVFLLMGLWSLTQFLLSLFFCSTSPPPLFPVLSLLFISQAETINGACTPTPTLLPSKYIQGTINRQKRKRKIQNKNKRKKMKMWAWKKIELAMKWNAINYLYTLCAGVYKIWTL